MKTFAVQYDDDSMGSVAAKPVVVIRTDSLSEAIKACDADRRKTYVLHVASDLQRHLFEGRVVWLDPLGREQPEPQGVGTR
ncbi:MAG: hypothetical protein C0483_02650 [Pirellula sp.]|nr:hypothetical protein [Pirellula sp.]